MSPPIENKLQLDYIPVHKTFVSLMKFCDTAKRRARGHCVSETYTHANKRTHTHTLKIYIIKVIEKTLKAFSKQKPFNKYRTANLKNTLVVAA